MKIVHLASELAPIAKVGGLADAVYGLCKSLIAKKQEIEVILPKYDILNLDPIDNLQIIQKNFPSIFKGQKTLNTIWKGCVDKIPVLFIESNDPAGLFNRSTVYGCKDDPLRFLYFCCTALDFLMKRGAPPDLVHLHDWHTASAAFLLKRESIPTVFTIHNLAYQGHCSLETFEKVGWKTEEINEFKDTEYPDTYSLLKAGILFADHITTVSPSYAKEIFKTNPLQEILKTHQKKLTGILNGIDFTYWNPKTDSLLPFHFHLQQLTQNPPFLKGKEKVKNYLRKRFNLRESQSTVVSSITRLVPQKGPKLIQAALSHTLKKGGQFILLGSTFDEEMRTVFTHLKQKLAHNRNVHMELTYNEELAHLVYAGSDLFVAPSLFEPCGLTPLIAMRYGTVPLVRQTGGMKDTVFEGKNGFSFITPTPAAIHKALNRALACWASHPKRWRALMKKGMEEDFSWSKSADAYLKIYRNLYRELLSVSKRIT
ncbi:MAG: glycogen synthase [Chlamydiales bacterium]